MAAAAAFVDVMDDDDEQDSLEDGEEESFLLSQFVTFFVPSSFPSLFTAWIWRLPTRGRAKKKNQNPPLASIRSSARVGLDGATEGESTESLLLPRLSLSLSPPSRKKIRRRRRERARLVEEGRRKQRGEGG